MISKKGKVFVLLMTLLGGVSSPLWSMEKENEEKDRSLIPFLSPIASSPRDPQAMPLGFPETGIPQTYKTSPVSVKAMTALKKMLFENPEPAFIKDLEKDGIDYSTFVPLLTDFIDKLNTKTKNSIFDSQLLIQNPSLNFSMSLSSKNMFALFVAMFEHMWRFKGINTQLNQKDSLLSSMVGIPFVDYPKAWNEAKKHEKDTFKAFQNLSNIFFSYYQHQHLEQLLPSVGFLKDVNFMELFYVGFVRNQEGFIPVTFSLSPWNNILIPYGDKIFATLGQRALIINDTKELLKESGIFLKQLNNDSVEMTFFYGEKSSFPFVMGKTALIPSFENPEVMERLLNNLDNLEGLSFFLKNSSLSWVILNLIKSCQFNEKKDKDFIALPTTDEDRTYLDILLLEDLIENLNSEAPDPAKVKALEWILEKEEVETDGKDRTSDAKILQANITEKLQTQTEQKLLSQAETKAVEEKKSDKQPHHGRRGKEKKNKWKVKTKPKLPPVKEKVEKKEDPILSGPDQQAIEAIKKQAHDYLQANKETARSRYQHLLALINAGIKETFAGQESLLSEIIDGDTLNTVGSHQNFHFEGDGMTLIPKHRKKKDRKIPASQVNSLMGKFLNKIVGSAEKRLKEKSLKESLKENKKSED